MSIDYSIYVGPVVRCKFTPRKDGRAPMDSLSDLDGANFMAIPSDSKAPKNEHVYWINRTKGRDGRPLHLDGLSNYFGPLPSDTREKDIVWMLEAHGKDIARMEKLYGVEHVSFDWGVFRWTS